MVDITYIVLIALILLQTVLFAVLMRGLNVRIMAIAQMVDARIGNALENLENVVQSDDPLGRIKGIIQLFQEMNNQPTITAQVIDIERDEKGKFS